ncbi:MAG: hypothetical protein O3A30_03880 [Bacteroidetes bacterium]|nr:hypothetical protein [Bacteroidota bacterium]
MPNSNRRRCALARIVRERYPGSGGETFDVIAHRVSAEIDGIVDPGGAIPAEKIPIYGRRNNDIANVI